MHLQATLVHVHEATAQGGASGDRGAIDSERAAQSSEVARSSRHPGFHRRSIEERRALIAAVMDADVHTFSEILESGGLDLDTADAMVENVLGRYALPFALTLNLRINGVDRLAPMVVEEPSVVAAASNAARIVRAGGGFFAEHDPAVMIGQVQLTGVADLAAAAGAIRAHEGEILALADSVLSRLVARGGGARKVEVRPLTSANDAMVIVHVLIDCLDAMGANLVNTACEAIAPRLAELASARVGLRILSNLADRRCVRVGCRIPAAALAMEGRSGDEVLDGIVNASRFAEIDPYRAATHNKGIMNGIDPVVIATGNDWRAVEAGAHAFAARTGRYTALATWRREGDELVGRLELPMALGTVGGTLRVHPLAQASLNLAEAAGAADLGMIAAAVGLASNLAALRALATEGIQRGHMSLHARSGALAAGPVSGVRSKPVAESAGGAPAIRSLTDIRSRHLPAIEQRLHETKASAALMRRMLAYHLETGGKRLRALLPIWVCENLGGAGRDAVDLGAGLELLHNATLIHDDLQDGDTHRRGRPTIWHRWGMPQAVNAGDLLIFEAFARIARAPAASRVLEHVAAALVQVTEGQAMEFQLQLPVGHSDHLPATSASWEAMARGKTGALFAACLRAGAAAAGASDAVLESAAGYGSDVGLLFQVQDDYLDLVGDKGRARPGADLMEGKLSFPIVWAFEHGRPSDVAPIRALLGRARDERTWEMADAALDALHRCGALDATAAWLVAALKAAEEHPMARVVPGWAAQCLAPVAHALEPASVSAATLRSMGARPPTDGQAAIQRG